MPLTRTRKLKSTPTTSGFHAAAAAAATATAAAAAAAISQFHSTNRDCIEPAQHRASVHSANTNTNVKQIQIGCCCLLSNNSKFHSSNCKHKTLEVVCQIAPILHSILTSLVFKPVLAVLETANVSNTKIECKSVSEEEEYLQRCKRLGKYTWKSTKCISEHKSV